MKPLPAWLQVHRRGGDFDKEGRDWLRRLCGPPPRPDRRAWRLRSIRWPKLARPFRWGRLLALSAIAAGLVALVSPWLPFFPGTAAAEQITGYARIIDGDTIDVGRRRIRLHGIDAPEMHQ
jgi:endonuclease YncB( thermonuclease family)